VTFSIVTGPCEVAGNSVHLTGAGTCTVRASQGGDANYNAATAVDRPFTIAKADQTVLAVTAAPSSAVYNTTFTTAATGGNSGNPVLITVTGICSLASGGFGSATVQMDSGTGTCNVAYNQAGNINYNSAAPVTAATTALKAIQIIAVTASAPHSHLTEAPSLSPLRVGRQVSRSRLLHRLLMAARIQDRVSPLPVALSRAKSCTTSWGIPTTARRRRSRRL